MVEEIRHPATDLDAAARALVSQALSRGAQDNATAVVVYVEALPHDNFQNNFSCVRQLPLPPIVKPGQFLDGLEVVDGLHASRVCCCIEYAIRAAEHNGR